MISQPSETHTLTFTCTCIFRDSKGQTLVFQAGESLTQVAILEEIPSPKKYLLALMVCGKLKIVEILETDGILTPEPAETPQDMQPKK